jgi:predicted Rossmann-fold nucleotide-binding protein
MMIGSEYWNPIRAAIQEVMLKEGTFLEGEVDIVITDSPAEAVAHINQVVQSVLKHE